MRRAISASLALVALMAMSVRAETSASTVVSGVTSSATNVVNSVAQNTTALLNSTATAVEATVNNVTQKDEFVNLAQWGGWAGGMGTNFEAWGEQSMQPRNDGVARDAVGVLCQPSVVTAGTSFNVQLWYTQSHNREADLIAVALQADTKEYFGGCKVPISGLQGQTDCQFNLKQGNGPLKFKTWISPRGEDAPNYITYVMINVPVGYETRDSCPSIGFNQRSPQLPPANWVQLTSVPDTIGRGQNAQLLINYNLATLSDATLSVNLMTWDWATHGSNPIATSNMVISSKSNAINYNFAVPANAQPGPDGLYFTAYITPVNGGYESRVAEDRIYRLSIGGASSAPRMRGTYVATPAAITATPAATAATNNNNNNQKVEVEANGGVRSWFGW